MIRIFTKFFKAIENFLNQPSKVFIVCLLGLFFSLLFQGSLFQLWSLNKGIKEVGVKKENLKVLTLELEKKLMQVNDPKFLEVEAQNQLDLAEEGDLVFVFTDASAN